MTCKIAGHDPFQEAQKPTAEQRPLPARPERLNAILMGNVAADAAIRSWSDSTENQRALARGKWSDKFHFD